MKTMGSGLIVLKPAPYPAPDEELVTRMRSACQSSVTVACAVAAICAAGCLAAAAVAALDASAILAVPAVVGSAVAHSGLKARRADVQQLITLERGKLQEWAVVSTHVRRLVLEVPIGSIYEADANAGGLILSVYGAGRIDIPAAAFADERQRDDFLAHIGSYRRAGAAL